MTLWEAYYHEVCEPMLRAQFPAQLELIAAGLVGDGSECFGYDDEISQDHDFGPGVMLWLTRQDNARFGDALQAEVARLPVEYGGFSGRQIGAWTTDRTGIFSIERFYARFIGLERPPETLDEWRRIPEANLAAATNGRVFSDPLGEFSRFRRSLLSFYPEDVRLKKMAFRCMQIGQAGQYNYARCLKRGETVAALQALAEFIRATISLVFLLNRRYKPFYKWMHRALGELPLLGRPVQQGLALLVSPECSDRGELIDAVCAEITGELRRQGLSDSKSDFLLDHGSSVQLRILDPELHALGPWVE